jgi:hypothetical protein
MASEDILRHCRDLKTRTYEGAAGDARQEVYRRAVELITPVVRHALEQTNADLLDATGEIEVVGPRPDGNGGTETVFSLSWPAQRSADETRSGAPVEPVRVIARFGAGTQHPHLSGTRPVSAPPGDYPLQVTSVADAERQRGNVSAIVEAELHVRIFEGGWRIIPAAARATT